MSEQKIFKQLAKVMQAVEPIKKDQSGQGIRYKFRGIEQVYNALHEFHAEHGILIRSEVTELKREERTTDKGKSAITTLCRIKWIFTADDGSFTTSETIGEGLDYGGDKSANKAMSAALKYALLQLYLIPTEETAQDATERTKLEPMKAGNISNSGPVVNLIDIESRIVTAGGDKDLKALSKVWNELSAHEQAHREVQPLFKKYREGIKNG